MIEKVSAAMDCLAMYREQEQAWLRSAGDLKCEAGCVRCCYQIPVSTLVSGVLIAADLWGKDDKRLHALIQQGAEQSVMMAEHGHIEGSHRWLDRNQPCALLGHDRRCVCYEYRPPACSSFYAADGPEVCDSAKPRDIVASLDNTDIQLYGFKLDQMFLEHVMGEDWTDTTIVAPLGTMAKAGLYLLNDEQAFAEFVIASSEVAT